MSSENNQAWSPYIAGFLSGLLAIASVLITGKYIGASTTFVRVAAMLEKIFNPQRVSQLQYFNKYAPKIDWQFMFVVGIFIGALIASLLTRSFRLQAVPDIWRKRFGSNALKRAIFAFFGAMIAIFGARLAGGCPSGHGLSGTMQLSISGFIALICFFIAGVASANLIYKKWR